MNNSESWKLIFVIPMALIMITIAPFFFAAWFSTVILIFQGFKDLALTFKLNPMEKYPVSILNLRGIIKLVKKEGWSLINVRVLGISIFLHGFGAIWILVGAMLVVEKLLNAQIAP